MRLMCIFAHPDDESMGMGATLAKYAAEGVEIHLICATRGERGWNGPPENYPGFAEMAKIRTNELSNAIQTLGIKSVKYLDYIDGDLDKADPAQAIVKIVPFIREKRPDVVISFAPDGDYGHPDHIAISQLTNASLIVSADPSYYPDAGPPHRVAKFYYMVTNQKMGDWIKVLVGDYTFLVDGIPRQLIIWPDWAITTLIESGDHYQAAINAILCHQSQLAIFGDLGRFPPDLWREYLSVNTFVRVYSMVNGGRKLENDLFDGLR